MKWPVRNRQKQEAGDETVLSNLRSVPISSPVDGVAIMLLKQSGDVATTGTPILLIEFQSSLVFQTAMTVLPGSLVILLDPVFNGLTVSLIVGTLVSTVSTVLVIPVIVYRVARGKVARGELFLG